MMKKKLVIAVPATMGWIKAVAWPTLYLRKSIKNSTLKMPIELPVMFTSPQANGTNK